MAPEKRKKPRKTEQNEIRFLRFRLPCEDPALFKRHLLSLAGISILVKLLVLVVTPVVFSSFVDLFDIGYYLQTATKVWMGGIPYVTFDYFYPPLSFISILLPFVVAIPFNSISVYIITHQVLMCCFDLGTTLLVYLVALRFYDQKRAFICGVLSATAIAAAYFVLTKFDAFPTFVLILSLALFLYGKEMAGYAVSALGFLVKWFPLLAFPYYLVYNHLQGVEKRTLLRRSLIVAGILLVFSLPIILLSWRGFLFPYLYSGGPVPGSRFLSQSQSLVFYLDFLASPTGISPIFGKLVYPLMILIQLGLLALYWKIGSLDQQVLTSFIFLAVLDFMVLNPVSSPQYVIWVTPFMALLLVRSLPSLLLFYAYQAWVYLEFPLMFNVLYTNQDWITAAAGGGIPGAFFFFTVKFVLLAAIVWVVVRQVRDLVKPAPARGK
jgi:hypothetical protein